MENVTLLFAFVLSSRPSSSQQRSNYKQALTRAFVVSGYKIPAKAEETHRGKENGQSCHVIRQAAKPNEKFALSQTDKAE